MATTTSILNVPVEDDQCVEWHLIDWNGYSAVMRVRGDRPRPRMVYLDGTLFLSSTSFSHARLVVRLSTLVFVIVEELEIPFRGAGQTTFRRRKKRAGAEADATYYLTNEARIRGNRTIDLRVDPPPDLAIEAVHTHSAEAAVEVWRRLGVPEVWVCDGNALAILVRQADRPRYATSDASVAFPFLKASEIFEWVSRPEVVSDTQWIIELRRWVQDTLLPRRAGGATTGE